MATTYTAIATVTVGSSGATSIDFTSIPQTYTDLIVLVSARNSANNAGQPWGGLCIQFNGSTSSYSSINLYGYGSGYGSGTYSDSLAFWGYITSQQSTASVFGNVSFYVANYTSSSNKFVTTDSVSENNGADGRQQFNGGLWSNTAAITSIKLVTADNNGSSVNFSQYSTATLYGISNS